MPRFYGPIGYGESIEDPEDSGIWVDNIVEKDYYGDVIRVNRRLEPTENLNSNITVQNSISVIADEFAEANFLNIKYVEWAGTKWTVSGVQIERPRMILTLGAPYNGPLPVEV